MPQSPDRKWGWGGSDHCVLPHPTVPLLSLGTHRAQLSDSLTTGVGRGQWGGELGQGLEDLDLPHPGISGGRSESRSALLQSRVVPGTTASAPSAGLSTRRGEAITIAARQSLHRALSLRGPAAACGAGSLAWDTQRERHPHASILGAQEAWAPPPDLAFALLPGSP